MNLLAPVARPIFKANHDYVMRNGGEGIAKLLGARLLAIDERASRSRRPQPARFTRRPQLALALG